LGRFPPRWVKRCFGNWYITKPLDSEDRVKTAKRKKMKRRPGRRNSRIAEKKAESLPKGRGARVKEGAKSGHQKYRRKYGVCDERP